MNLPPQSLEDLGKLTLVLDIDETLVHSHPISESLDCSCKENAKITNNMSGFVINSINGGRLVNKRPFLEEFLLYASQYFEIITYTAGTSEYANPLLDQIEREIKFKHSHMTGRIFKHRLFREHCVGGFIKDLRVLNRDLSRTILVDNCPWSFLYQPSNGIPINSFFHDNNDTALIMLASFLEKLKHEQDVRSSLHSVFKLTNMLTLMLHERRGVE